MTENEKTLIAALETVLDQIDYVKGYCAVTEMVGAVLPKEVIAVARTAIAKAKE